MLVQIGGEGASDRSAARDWVLGEDGGAKNLEGEKFLSDDWREDHQMTQNYAPGQCKGATCPFLCPSLCC
jgi:hypothetical protein